MSKKKNVENDAREGDIEWIDEGDVAKDRGPRRKDELSVSFVARPKEKGEILKAADWNWLQDTMAHDLAELFERMGSVEGCGELSMASGVASHGVTVDLGWDSEPLVIVGQVTPLRDLRPPWDRLTPPDIVTTYRVTGKGRFRIMCSTGDERVWGCASWMALGVVER